MPTPMMLPITRLVDCGRLSRDVLAGVSAVVAATGELCGHDSSSVSLPSDRRGTGPGYGLRPSDDPPKVPNRGPNVPRRRRPCALPVPDACVDAGWMERRAAVAAMGRGRDRSVSWWGSPCRRWSASWPVDASPLGSADPDARRRALRGRDAGARAGGGAASGVGSVPGPPGSWRPASAPAWPGSSGCCRRPPTTPGRRGRPIWVAVTAATVWARPCCASIGTAQVLVLPAGTRGRLAWVGWTALGWCAGLTAFSVVAPPLWQSGQPIWLLTVIGVAGGLAMAVTMAAVTGVGAVRLVDRARRGGSGEFTLGRHLLSTMLGTPVYDASGRRLGRVSDVVGGPGDQARVPDRDPRGDRRRRTVVASWLPTPP